MPPNHLKTIKKYGAYYCLEPCTGIKSYAIRGGRNDHPPGNRTPCLIILQGSSELAVQLASYAIQFHKRYIYADVSGSDLATVARNLRLRKNLVGGQIMVSLEFMRASNARIVSELPSGLIAVFFGATSGIGETTLKQFVKHAKQPRIYFAGRREGEGDRIKSELKTLNPDGEYHYMKCDVSLLKNVDRVCRDIKSKEFTINLLFITVGTLITGKYTEEGLYYPSAVSYYARMRLIVNLLPLLTEATSLRRVVTVLAGGKEGQIFTDDFQAINLGITSIRGHVTSMTTLGLEAIAKKAPNVSFIHDYPGFVETGMSREIKGPLVTVMGMLFKPVMAFLKIPIEEVGERHTFFSTSARFPPASEEPEAKEPKADGVTLGKDVQTAISTEGKAGGGVYSIDYEAKGTCKKVRDILADMRNDGTAEKAWKNTQDEFLRITGTVAI